MCTTLKKKSNELICQVREAYLQWFETSSYTSAHDLIGGEMNTFDENQTNYLYCTHFFGMHVSR